MSRGLNQLSHLYKTAHLGRQRHIHRSIHRYSILLVTVCHSISQYTVQKIRFRFLKQSFSFSFFFFTNTNTHTHTHTHTLPSLFFYNAKYTSKIIWKKERLVVFHQNSSQDQLSCRVRARRTGKSQVGQTGHRIHVHAQEE